MEYRPDKSKGVGSLLSGDPSLEALLQLGDDDEEEEEIDHELDQKKEEALQIEQGKPPAIDMKPFNLDEYGTEQELQALGMDRLKNALTQLGLKCGGTLEERTKRLLSVKGLSYDQYPKKLLAKRKTVPK